MKKLLIAILLASALGGCASVDSQVNIVGGVSLLQANNGKAVVTIGEYDVYCVYGTDENGTVVILEPMDVMRRGKVVENYYIDESYIRKIVAEINKK